MINLKILVPEETVNYCKNPSFEVGTSGWTIRTGTDSDNYYLYDTFSTDRAAGAVNGTQAEPVGGTRSVTDTNSKIAISGGLLDFATGSAINDKVAWSTIARTLGVGVMTTINLANTTSKPNIGWGGSDLFIFNNAGTSLFVNVNASAFLVVGTYSATTYQTMVLYRTAGMFWFIKGGAFTNWTLMYTSLAGTASKTPQVLTQLATSIFTVADVRAPKLTYIPSPLQSDGFSNTVTDGLGNPENNGTAGNAYTDIGTWGVAGGKKATTVAGISLSVLSTTTRNVFIEVDIVRAAGNPGIVARFSDASNYIQCLYDGANVVVAQRVAGVFTVLSTTAVAYSAGATMKFVADGLTYRAFYNNTGAGNGVLPSTLGTSHGIWSNDTGNTFDNLVIWAVGNSETQYAGLDTFEFPAPDTENRSTDRARFGTASCKVTTDGSLMNEGIYYRVNLLQGISDVLTASIYARGGGKVRLRLTDGGSNSGISKAVNLTDDRWHRLEATGRCSGSDDIRLYIETAESLPRSVTFYVDGAQIERKSAATSYCDGDQPGCRWNVVANATLSTRTADTREGGRWVPLAGPCRPNNDLYVTTLGGFGMPPIVNNIQSWANAPGSFFQNEKIQNRVVTFSFHVKKESFRTGGSAPSILALHELRQQLINLFKSDVTLNSQAFLFEYSDSETDKKLYIRMRYEAGLEGEWDIRNRWFNSFPVRMIAVDPLWSEDNQDVMPLVIKDTYSGLLSQEWVRVDGQWQRITESSGASTNAIYAPSIVEGNDGSIYIAEILTAGTLAGRVVKWDGSSLTNIGTTDSGVFSMAVAPDGTLYAGGGFTTIGGVAAARIAKYTPSTGVWSALGAGLNNNCYSVCVAPNGQVYVCGQFTTAGGVSCLRVARWDGLQWRTVGATSGVNGTIAYSLVNAGDGKTIYMGGDFTTSNGGSATYNRVASIDTETNLISTMGYGVSNTVLSLAVGLDGTVYAGGSFLASAAPSADALLHVAKWSGGQIWEPLGDGLEKQSGSASQVSVLEIGLNGELFAGGTFDASGEKELTVLSKWFGGNWLPLEFPSAILTRNASINAILQTENGNLYVGGFFDETNYEFPKLNTITNNGTASCWPTLTVTGAGTLHYISNVKTGQEIFLDLNVFSGETVTIDFARGKIESDTRGDLNYTLLSGSEIRSIYLLPGENTISVLMTDDVDATMQLRWEPLDWSADAIIEADDL